MKKIMFDDKYGLTKAVLEGRKTMTRRIVNPSILPKITEMRVLSNGTCQYKDPYIGKWYDSGKRSQPKYQVGEVVAVAQKYKDIPNPFYGRATDYSDAAGWSNKMFVRANLMPHQIRITNVRVEHLQDISDQDCIKEGVGRNSDIMNYSGPRDAFAALIDRISGKGTWLSNPWVFVYEFELIK